MDDDDRLWVWRWTPEKRFVAIGTRAALWAAIKNMSLAHGRLAAHPDSDTIEAMIAATQFVRELLGMEAEACPERSEGRER